MQLPSSNTLSTNRLGAVFNNTTATYKYFWFLAILELHVRGDQKRILIWDIIIEMITLAWYPVHYFKLNFGQQDSMTKQMQLLQEAYNLNMAASQEDLSAKMHAIENQKELHALIRVFTQNVPFRFLSPWINTSDDKELARRSESYENGCLYSLTKEGQDWYITINPDWYSYLRENYGILRDFAYWNLSMFLQTRNPNVPNISNKLIKPIERTPLTRQREFWNIVFDCGEELNCIYTGRLLSKAEYDLDHFMPWSFVAHDLIWNLLPADSSINSSKSNHIPSLEQYLLKMAKMQQLAVKTVKSVRPSNRLLEDYLTIVDSLDDMIMMDDDHLLTTFSHHFEPIAQIAMNMGFESWQNS